MAGRYVPTAFYLKHCDMVIVLNLSQTWLEKSPYRNWNIRSFSNANSSLKKYHNLKITHKTKARPPALAPFEEIKQGGAVQNHSSTHGEVEHRQLTD